MHLIEFKDGISNILLSYFSCQKKDFINDKNN